MLNRGEVYDRVVIFDYDGVITDGNPMAVLSMMKGLEEALHIHGLGKFDSDAFSQAAVQSKGTTEQVFFDKYLKLKGLGLEKIRELESTVYNDFIVYRKRFLAEMNKKRDNKKSDEGYINKDFIHLMQSLKKMDQEDGIKTCYIIATGNPIIVLDERLPDEVRNMFNIVEGGESGFNRKDIIQDVLGAMEFRKEINKATKVFYLDDTSEAILSVADKNPEGRQRHNYDVFSIHVDRLNQPSEEILNLEKRPDHPVFHVKNLRDISLMSYLNPKNHGSIEGSLVNR